MNAQKCPGCGATIDTLSGDDLCPACLLRNALDPLQPGDDVEEAGPVRANLPRPFGPYELLEEIGRGGMGVVYRARQPALGRMVAVKLLLAGSYSSEAALRRFQLEAAAAAGLHHPNVVEIHDYGEVDGQPYYAMNLVSGRNLADLCAGRPLAARDAAGIIHLLARAVHHAHQRCILHRDLKPSNVLIDDEGRPRITDFGLAKVLCAPKGATLTGQMLGSPSYTSPEQASGRASDTGIASDVYGLGAIFYHLATGRAPFNAATSADTLRLVLDSDPPPPRLLNPALPRDLETICLKCLEKDPARRYATADELADDVERFLGEHPIRARPPGLWYRLSKFTRRHRPGVAAAAIAVVALGGGLTSALLGIRRAVVQGRAADAARSQAEQLVGLMAQDLRPTLEQRGGPGQLARTLEATISYYEALPEELRSSATDRAHANALFELARVRGLSLADRAGGEKAIRAAIALHDKLARANPGDAEAAAGLIFDEWLLPWVMGDGSMMFSEQRHETMVRRARELLARFPDHPQARLVAAEVLSGYAHFGGTMFHKPHEAVVAATEARTLVEELLAKRPLDDTLVILKVRNLQALTAALQSAGEETKAITVSEETLAFCTRQLKADPGNLRIREQAAEAARNLSYRAFNFNHGRALEAEHIAREHYRILSELNPDDQEYRHGYAVSHMMECFHRFLFEPDMELTRHAFHRFHTLLEPFVTRKGYEDTFEHWTLDCLYLAAAAARAGDPLEAQQQIERARLRATAWFDLSPKGSVERHLRQARHLAMEAWAYGWMGDWPAVARSAHECLTNANAALKERPDDDELLLRRAVARALLGAVAQREGRPEEAIALLEPALEAMHMAPSLDTHHVYELPWYFGIAQRALAEARLQLGDIDGARQASEWLLGKPIFDALWPAQAWKGSTLTLAARLRDPATEAPLRLALIERAEFHLARPDRTAREDEADVARAALVQLRNEVAASLDTDRLEKLGRELDAAGADAASAIARISRSVQASWNSGRRLSANGSQPAREVEQARRATLRSLIERHPGSTALRFLLAETYRMECYVHFDWDGDLDAAHRAFADYDARLAPFLDRRGYEPVRWTRTLNSLHRAQLAASMDDREAALSWLAEARERFATWVGSSPGGTAEQHSGRVRFLEEEAWVAWWLRDWPGLRRCSQEMLETIAPALADHPADVDFLLQHAMATGFGALADFGEHGAAGSLEPLQSAAAGFFHTWLTSGIWEADRVMWTVGLALLDALHASDQTAQARGLTETWMSYFDSLEPAITGDWWTRKTIAALEVRLATMLDPTSPIDAARRTTLLDRAAAALTLGDPTMDVRDLLTRVEKLRSGTATSR